MTIPYSAFKALFDTSALGPGSSATSVTNLVTGASLSVTGGRDFAPAVELGGFKDLFLFCEVTLSSLVSGAGIWYATDGAFNSTQYLGIEVGNSGENYNPHPKVNNVHASEFNVSSPATGSVVRFCFRIPSIASDPTEILYYRTGSSSSIARTTDVNGGFYTSAQPKLVRVGSGTNFIDIPAGSTVHKIGWGHGLTDAEALDLVANGLSTTTYSGAYSYQSVFGPAKAPASATRMYFDSRTAKQRVRIASSTDSGNGAISIYLNTSSVGSYPSGSGDGYVLQFTASTAPSVSKWVNGGSATSVSSTISPSSLTLGSSTDITDLSVTSDGSGVVTAVFTYSGTTYTLTATDSTPINGTYVGFYHLGTTHVTSGLYFDTWAPVSTYSYQSVSYVATATAGTTAVANCVTAQHKITIGSSSDSAGSTMQVFLNMDTSSAASGSSGSGYSFTLAPGASPTFYKWTGGGSSVGQTTVTFPTALTLPAGTGASGSESFTAANGTTLVTLQPDWSGPGTNFEVNSNKLYPTAAYSRVRLAGGSWGPDHYVSFKIYGLTGGTYNHTIILRDNNAGDGYYIFMYPTIIYVSKYVAYSGTTIVSQSVTVAEGDVIYTSIVGSVITVKVNGATVISTTDSNLTVGRPSIGIYTVTSSIDDLTWGDASPVWGTVTDVVATTNGQGNLSVMFDYNGVTYVSNMEDTTPLTGTYGGVLRSGATASTTGISFLKYAVTSTSLPLIDILSGGVEIDTRQVHPASLGAGMPDGTKFLRDDGQWVSPSSSPASTAFSVDFGTTPVFGGQFDITFTGATASDKFNVVPDPSFVTDEMEMDGFICAAYCLTSNFVRVFINAVPGPVVGSRNFNLLKG